jgi:hypothetical protein
MVLAILDGRKSMTRRVVKGSFPIDKEGLDLPPHKHSDGTFAYHFQTHVDDYVEHPIKPRYQTGDILWVRETFNDDETADVLYAADQDFVDYGCKDIDDRTIFESNVKWRPSIFMPREAARIFLRVTDVRVERVQDISYDDCLLEGMHDYGTEVDTLAAFQDLWESLNAKRGYSWASNTWVWVISFERCEKPQEEKL